LEEDQPENEDYILTYLSV
jgi:hypothetical protein